MNRTGLALATIFFLACLVLVQKQAGGWNDASRLAAIESLVERRTWSIDDSSWIDFTQDKILVNDTFYSDKMPLFSFIGAGVYEIMRAFGGSVRMDCAQVGRFCGYAPLTLILVSLPAAILIYLFFDYALQQRVPQWSAIVGTVALGLGTMLFPYALALNHHAPAAASVFASFYLLTRWRADPRALVAAGFFAALAPSFDALSGIVAAALFGIAAVCDTGTANSVRCKRRSQIALFILGAAIPIAITALLDYQIARTLLPPYTVTNAYNYPGSAFPNTIAGNGTPDDYPAYAFRMFLGGKGLFAYNPLLIFALVGAVRVAFDRADALRGQAVATVLGFVFLCVYLATQTGNYGGTAYGERWFVVAIPVLFSFIFFAPPLNRATWQSAWWLLFVPLLALSIVSSLQGSLAPWQDWLPPLQMTRDVSKFPYLGFRWNLRFQ